MYLKGFDVSDKPHDIKPFSPQAADISQPENDALQFSSALSDVSCFSFFFFLEMNPRLCINLTFTASTARTYLLWKSRNAKAAVLYCGYDDDGDDDDDDVTQ